ncbi:7-cyano-7-deazaguanine synthase [Muricoccus vinaceus]|uniref:7-cyano-7-deazaguanine synthase n=1 Tax=Muricoccus vinaceus TaxID=424704 RepID=A0ABV6IY40_9PROT
MKTALLLSGGMDSTALAWWLRPDYGVTVDYGQLPAEAEIRAAGAVCGEIGIEHVVIRADLRVLGSGDMAGTERSEVAPVSEWWPFRNQMLVTLAAMRLLPLGVGRLLIGCLSTDGAHADGRADFVVAADALLAMQEGSMRLEAPAVELTAAELLRRSDVPRDVLSWAHSCHVSNFACGMCRGCQKHYVTLKELGDVPY